MSDEAHVSSTVLVVEDEPLVRLVAADLLESEGIDVLEASDSREALHLIETHPEVCLLFSDINMPGPLDGMELVTLVVQHWPNIEILITSGRHRLPDTSLPDHGTFLPKPYSVAALINAVKTKLSVASTKPLPR